MDFPMPTMLREVRQQIREQIGEAIEAYASVEAEQAMLLRKILAADYREAFIIFFAVQNVRARGEMIQDLLDLRFGGRLKSYWANCNKFLLALAKFRNAVAHWHPYTNLYENEDQTRHYEPALGPPNPNNLLPLEAKHFPAFIADCAYIIGHLQMLATRVGEGPESLPQKFQAPAIRRNLAVLPQREMPKAQKPRRPPSVPKLSPAQIRAKALKDAREKKS
jgi:hypothetical protein